MTSTLRALVTALGVAACAGPACAEEPPGLKPEVDKVVRPLLKGKKGVGIVVGVIDKQGPRVFGYGDVAVNGGKAPDGDTVFEIGSITKVFTTLVLAQMVREGLVKLDDPVQDYLPREAKVPRRNGKDITLLHLATHTSGLPVQPTNLRWHVLVRPWDWDNPYAHYGTKPLYTFLAGYRLPRDPGDRYEYSNLGMGLLGMALVHRAKARDYDELIVRRIGDPLGMKDTRVALSARQRDRFAQGHDEDGGPTSTWDFETMEGFGAIRSSANDLLRFLAANLGHTRTKLRAALEDCHKPRRDTPDKQVRVGLGWHVLTLPGAGDPVVCHSGETGGFHAFLGFVKATGTGVVLLGNSCQLGKKIDLAGVTLLGKMNPRK
jgi:CubicO group peptidase (beta-lactamase class C family)